MYDPLDELGPRWKRLWLRLGADVIPPLDPVIAAYQLPPRHYHNLHHIWQCLAELDELRASCEAPDTVELAIWYHDIVYDATKHDNERQSAEVAVTALREAGIDAATVDRVSALIMATQHATAPAPGDQRIIVDIDLSILGRPQAEFDGYEQAIRKEYSHVEEQAFRVGRSTILQKFLDRRAIYSTPVMQQRYEITARDNLRRSLERLQSGAGAAFTPEST